MIPNKQVYRYEKSFNLERGGQLPSLEIAYHTYGELNEENDNVVWVFHALTANSDCVDWWGNLLNENNAINPEKHFIICANILGSPYGTTSPLSLNSGTGEKFYAEFPAITIRDMVEAHKLLRDHLGIQKIAIGLGGSMGGFQTFEWAVQEPDTFDKIILIGTAPKESPWRIAIHATQRLAIEADPTWRDRTDTAGKKGVEASRAIGILSYRNHEIFRQTQSDEEEILDDFKSDSYIRYQGTKLTKRNFQGYLLWNLTKALDSHDIGRGRGGVEKALASLKPEVLLISITSDLLFPIEEQRVIEKYISNVVYKEIDSLYGHDGFLTEDVQINALITEFL
ncbi:MAG: homoserine O-acetyltransferase [Reichenbachiella sp.]